MNDMLRRQAALEATLGKYRNRPIVWGTTDCVRAARFHLLQMGHKPPPMPQYRSAIGAKRALTRVGGMMTVFDALLPRIAPARMLAGDVALLPGTSGFDSVCISLGMKFAGWAEDYEDVGMMNLIISPADIVAAWRA